MTLIKKEQKIRAHLFGYYGLKKSMADYILK